MKIAVTFENGMVCQHFGHTEEFKVFNVENGEVTSSSIVEATEGGHSALSILLQENKVDVLICGGIGGGAQNALKEMGIKLFGGVSGSVDAAVENFLTGKLDFNPNVQCNHFDADHKGEEHVYCHDDGGCKHNCKK